MPHPQEFRVCLDLVGLCYLIGLLFSVFVWALTRKP